MNHLRAFVEINENALFHNSLIPGTPIVIDVNLRRWASRTVARVDRAVGHTSAITPSEPNKIRDLNDKSPAFHSQIMCYGSRPICPKQPILAFIL
jgi:hypothetical protein